MVLPEVRNLRLAAGKTVSELAQVLHVDEMKYMLYERNADCMPSDALLTLAAYYGVPPRELYKGVYFPTLFS